MCNATRMQVETGRRQPIQDQLMTEMGVEQAVEAPVDPGSTTHATSSLPGVDPEAASKAACAAMTPRPTTSGASPHW